MGRLSRIFTGTSLQHKHTSLSALDRGKGEVKKVVTLGPRRFRCPDSASGHPARPPQPTPWYPQEHARHSAGVNSLAVSGDSVASPLSQGPGMADAVVPELPPHQPSCLTSTAFPLGLVFPMVFPMCLCPHMCSAQKSCSLSSDHHIYKLLTTHFKGHFLQEHVPVPHPIC